MRAGQLKDRVLIQSNSGVEDALGQQTDVWTTVADRRCSIEPLNGREYFAAQGENVSVSVRVRFRYEAGLLAPAQRLYDPRTIPATIYDVESVIDHGNEHRELIAMCAVRG